MRSPSRPEELLQLRDWCTAIVRYIASLSAPEPLFVGMEEAIDRAFERRDLRGLRMVARDLAEWASDLSPEHQEQLDGQLLAQLGRGLRDARQDAQNEVSRILRRGQIDTADECRLLMSRADEIYADDSKRAELERINALLAAYEFG
jgi:hypothetical protein